MYTVGLSDACAISYPSTLVKVHTRNARQTPNNISHSLWNTQVGIFCSLTDGEYQLEFQSE